MFSNIAYCDENPANSEQDIKTTNLSSHKLINDATSLENEVKLLTLKVGQIETNQLNYKIEKDLLKETYSNNYERINVVITIVLAVLGLFGYMGLKDISTIKGKYEEELAKLITLKGDFESKVQQIEFNKNQVDHELNELIKQNQEQNQKIKFIELKDRAFSLLRERILGGALEFLNMALKINPADLECLNAKGSVLIQLNQKDEALKTFQLAHSTDPDNKTSLLNYTECLYLCNQIRKAEEVIKDNMQTFTSVKDGKLPEFFNLFKYYYEKNINKLNECALSLIKTGDVNNPKKIMGSEWDLTDAKVFLNHQKDSAEKKTLMNILWFWNGEIDGKTLLRELGLKLNE